jgi:hypothetical protein
MKKIRWVGQVARMGEWRGVYMISLGQPEGTRPLGRPRRRWEDNVNMEIQGVGFGVMDWIVPVQERDRCRAPVNAVMNIRDS